MITRDSSNSFGKRVIHHNLISNELNQISIDPATHYSTHLLTNTLLILARVNPIAHCCQLSYLYSTRCPAHVSSSRVLTNHIAATTHIYTALAVKLIVDHHVCSQSALTIATTSLSSAHQDLYKRQSSNPTIIIDHISQSVITSTQRSQQLFTAPTQPLQLSSSHALRPGNFGNCHTATAAATLQQPRSANHTACRAAALQQPRRKLHSITGRKDLAYYKGADSASTLAVAQRSFSGPANF
jgi:hypothetical protein